MMSKIDEVQKPLQADDNEGWVVGVKIDDNDAKANGWSNNVAHVTVTQNNYLKRHIPLTLTLTGSAKFRNDDGSVGSSQKKHAKTGPDGRVWNIEFVDGVPEPGTLTAKMVDPPNARGDRPYKFVTSHDYELQIAIGDNGEDNNAPADSLSRNEATATFTDGTNPAQGTIIFTFEGENSASFVDTGDPHIVKVTDKEIQVTTDSGGTAKADFIDSNTSGEDVTLAASVQSLPDLKPEPASLDFTFKRVDSSRGLFLYPLNNYANAKSTQQDKCLALLTENGLPTDGTVVFTLPKDKSASFVDPQDAYTTYLSPTEIRVKTQSGFATAAFTDSNSAGETVTLEACALDTKPATQPFVFNAEGTLAEYTIKLHVDKNNQYAGGDDSATATVFKGGVQITEPEKKTVVFTLSPLANSANFSNNPDLLGYLLKILEVQTKDGQAQALVYDGVAETVHLHAILKDGSATPATPVDLTFIADSYNIDLDDPNNVDNQQSGGPLNKCIAHITWGNQDVYDDTIVQFEVDKSAVFDTTNVYEVKSPQCIWMQTQGGKTSAQFSDSNLAGEGVTITVSLPKFPSAGSQTKDFTFTAETLSGVIYLQADNGLYVSVDDFSNIGVVKNTPDDSCKFTLVPRGGSKVALLASNGKYVFQDPAARSMQAIKSDPYEFMFYIKEKFSIILKAIDINKYVSRIDDDIHLGVYLHYLAAAKDDPDAFCNLTVTWL